MTTATRTPLRADDSVQQYLKKIGRTPLLTAEQEVELGRRIAAGAKAGERLAGSAGLDEAARPALERVVADGRRASDQMVQANLRLVVSTAKRYAARGGLPLLDLVQEGTIGMMRAVEKFDHTRGFKFSTYATWWIKQAIGRALADQGRAIRLPSQMADVVNKVLRTRRTMAMDLGREPTVAELATAVEVPEQKVVLALRYASEPVSLHTSVTGEVGDTELGDLLADDAPDTATLVAMSELRGYLDTALTSLTEREAAVIVRRFGLDDDRPRTLEEIGREYGLSRERIRQLEAKGMSKLRRPANTRVLQDLLS
ncbi:sigma-70 family RNA polymerase sigma factor [Solicola gregarius]|uniref:Sigma-70 family RNA polymerase sigma factor n=1 Tax=Solicola gregarius TaxID=2908642 RepID=A0AA46TG87_9ACTN|nr:sigma-70 family RNA polymerase sigma factor [Solicola gregarius]UYM04756.1 sigma-70 family RNA polymerase sigma factor [Solicola gregarius]